MGEGVATSEPVWKAEGGGGLREVLECSERPEAGYPKPQTLNPKTPNNKP